MKYNLFLIFTLFSNLTHPSWFDTYKDEIKSVLATYPKTTICFALGLGGGLYFKKKAQTSHLRYRKKQSQEINTYTQWFEEFKQAKDAQEKYNAQRPAIIKAILQGMSQQFHERELSTLKSDLIRDEDTDLENLELQIQEYIFNVQFEQPDNSNNLNQLQEKLRILQKLKEKIQTGPDTQYNDEYISYIPKNPVLSKKTQFLRPDDAIWQTIEKDEKIIIPSINTSMKCEWMPENQSLKTSKMTHPLTKDPRCYPDYRLYQGYSTLSKTCFGLSTAAALYGLSQAGWVQTQDFIKTASDFGALFLANTSAQTNIPLITHK